MSFFVYGDPTSNDAAALTLYSADVMKQNQAVRNAPSAATSAPDIKSRAYSGDMSSKMEKRPRAQSLSLGELLIHPRMEVLILP